MNNAPPRLLFISLDFDVILSGNDWTPNDLLAYDISVVHQDSATFFGTPNLPVPQVDNEVFTIEDAAAVESDDSYAFLRTMDLAMAPRSGEEPAVDDFAIQLFKILRYTGRAVGRVVRTRKNLSFWVCGQERHVQTDICIMDLSDILLLVQEDKRHMDGSDPELQLIAEAIAASYQNNDAHVRSLGLDALASKVMPGITMQGTMPIFYKIPVTTDLVRAVQLGECPTQATAVYAHVPRVARPARRYSEGMKPLDNRRIIFSCYEAFKRFLRRLLGCTSYSFGMETSILGSSKASLLTPFKDNTSLDLASCFFPT